MKSFLFAAALVATCTQVDHAQACGGCFHQEKPTNPNTTESVVTGHRMVFALSEKRTVLWDQIEYTGSPEEFAWVLPIKPGAYVEQSTDAFFEVLEAVTRTSVAPPYVQCVYPTPDAGDYYPGGYYGSSSSHGCDCSCGSDESAAAAPYSGGPRLDGVGGASGAPHVPPPVQVLHQGTVGPYDTVTLSSKDPNALRSWLKKHGFAIPPDIDPIIDMYVTEGADFIALRLKPGAGVNAMTPVRVVTPNGPGILPLRMVAAGTGDHVDIVLYVIGESRYGLADLTETRIDRTQLSYDFSRKRSNYATLREDALAENLGTSYLSTFAANGAFSGFFSNISVGPLLSGDIPSLYFTQANIDEGKPLRSTTSCSTTGFSSDKLVIEAKKPGAADGGLGDAAHHDAAAAATEAGAEAGRAATEAGAEAGHVSTEAGRAATDAALSPTEISSADLVCQGHSDVAAALIGMHPSKVWLTRLDMNLPHEALTMDCRVEASSSKSTIGSTIGALKYTGDPCPGGSVAAGSTSIESFPRAGVIFTLLGLLLRRRRDRVTRRAPLAA